MVIFTDVNRNYKNTNFNMEYIRSLTIYIDFTSYDYSYFEYIKYKDYYIKYYYIYKLISIMYINYSYKLHRENGPAYINYNNGEIYKKEYWLNGRNYSYDDHLLDEYFTELNNLV